MNKKILMFGLLMVLGLGVVSALAYYGVFSASVSVVQPVSIEGTLNQVITNCIAGETCLGQAITIYNDAPSDRTMKILKNGSSDIQVGYVGKLQLTKKNTADWTPLEDKFDLTYTLIGNEFKYSEIPLGYSLVYYKDGVIGLDNRTNNPQPAILVTSDIGSLPQTDDANLFGDYSQAPDSYAHKIGAKIWLVPTNAITEGNLDWSRMSEFYFETDLIFSFASEDTFVVPAGSFITLYPTFSPSNHIESGDYEFNFEVI